MKKSKSSKIENKKKFKKIIKYLKTPAGKKTLISISVIVFVAIVVVATSAITFNS
ncbi:hypothetical protein N8G13_02720 [Mycoplasma zalophi]|uniref:hypothetical protein n=1 Tax=Mycoplasma zalophi TaxID=191287 RepID=UPI0021C748E3|nr:hypothetical protein [Mycoplasma zalophi]MCU4117359.1 hypothetical protein [Mycoplasma zalophi]